MDRRSDHDAPAGAEAFAAELDRDEFSPAMPNDPLPDAPADDAGPAHVKHEHHVRMEHDSP